MEPLYRAYEAQVDDVGTSQRTVTAIVNTGSVDRYNTVIDPAGINLEPYRKNPVVLWEHGKDPTRGRLPIGRNLWIKRQGRQVVARTEFGKDDYSQSLFEMYRDGLLRGWSIFALPDASKASPPTRSEIAADPELKRCEMVYRACELGEYSGVAVPGNKDTLSILEARSIWYPQERTTVATPSPQRDGDEESDPDEMEPDGDADDDGESRFIKKVGDQWGVFSEAGKLLAKHPTREGAVKQLQAIEAHKHDDAGRSAPELPPLEGVTFREIHAAMAAEIHRYYRDRIELVAATLDLIRGRV